MPFDGAFNPNTAGGAAGLTALLAAAASGPASAQTLSAASPAGDGAVVID